MRPTQPIVIEVCARRWLQEVRVHDYGVVRGTFDMVTVYAQPCVAGETMCKDSQRTFQVTVVGSPTPPQLRVG